MPDYRKFYNSAGHSEKVSSLTHFEFRVWIQMRASADDFGVGPLIPGKLQGDNRVFAREAKSKPREATRALERAMRVVVHVGLFEVFEHQGQEYYFQPDWQDREAISYPKRSVYPYPPADRITPKTLELIQLAEESLSKKREKKSQKNSEKISKTSGDYAHAGARTSPQPITNNPPEESLRETKPAVLVRPAPVMQSPLKWKHGEHEHGFCDWMCLPVDLVDQFAQRIALSKRTTPAAERSGVLVWARGVMASGVVPTGKMYDFWNAQWDQSRASSDPRSVPPDVRSVEETRAMLARFPK